MNDDDQTNNSNTIRTGRPWTGRPTGGGMNVTPENTAAGCTHIRVYIYMYATYTYTLQYDEGTKGYGRLAAAAAACVYGHDDLSRRRCCGGGRCVRPRRPVPAAELRRRPAAGWISSQPINYTIVPYTPTHTYAPWRTACPRVVCTCAHVIYYYDYFNSAGNGRVFFLLSPPSGGAVHYTHTYTHAHLHSNFSSQKPIVSRRRYT